MNMPVLRFKDNELQFPEWGSVKLSKLASIYDGTHMTPDYKESGVPFYSVEHVTNNNFRDTKFIAEDIFDKENKRVRLEKGDILLTRIGDIGTPKFIDWDVRASFYVSLALIKQSKHINSRYLSHYVNTSFFQRELHHRTIHVAFPKKINLGEIGECLVSFPTAAEQTKIANFLTAVDEKITQLTQKCELLAQYKKGVMQQIFSQELRFKDDDGQDFPEWEEKFLGELYSITSSKRVFQSEWTKSGVPFYRAREVVKLSETGNVDNELFISLAMYNDYKIKYGVPKPNDLLVTGVGTLGRLYVVKESDKFYFKDGNIIWFKSSNKVNSQFVKQLFQSPLIKKQIEDGASITTVGTYTIDSANKTKIPYPSLNEQEKIANFLTAIDDKLAHTQAQLTAAKQYKQGLLQQMFV